MKSNKTTFVKLDTRNRISLTKVAKNLSAVYKAYLKDDKIILEPVYDIPEEERWLFDPKNKELVQELKKAIKKEANIDLGSFKKYVK